MDRFDLETEIMNAWCVVDDIKIIKEKCIDDVTEERLDAVLTLYQMKFEKLFFTFETLISDGKLDKQYPSFEALATGRLQLTDHLGRDYEFDKDPDYDVSETFSRGTLYRKK